MIDLKFLRENPEAVKENIKKKFQEEKLPLVDQVLALDAENRRTIQEAQDLRTARNALSKRVGMLMGQAKKDPSKLAEAEQAKAQANNFAEILQGKDTDSLPAMDFESFGSLSQQEINDIAITFMETLAQATGKTPIIYSDLYNARDLFDAQLAAYPLWIAEYGPSSPGDPGKWDSWVGFQYSSSGSVPGINGNVDLDKFTAGALIKIDGFVDIADSWAEEDIVFMVKEKLMDGTSSLLFSPDLALNRAMMVTILWRIEGQPTTTTEIPFTDVTTGEYYTEAVGWAYDNNIVEGTSSDLFSPALAATREQLATILYRYSEYKGYDTSINGSLDEFTDADQVSAYAITPMEWAVGTKLILGEDNLLEPQRITTRAQAAAIFHRFIENIAQ